MVTLYLLGFAVGQPLYGALSARFGRKPGVVVGLCIYALGSLGAVLAPGFSAFLHSRAARGMGAASPRIMAGAIVRDRFAGAWQPEKLQWLLKSELAWDAFAAGRDAEAIAQGWQQGLTLFRMRRKPFLLYP